MSKKANFHGHGDGMYGIGIYDERSNQYHAPLDEQTARATGCHAEFANVPIGKMSRRRAMARARSRWGYALESD